ncbi:type 1 fimbria pilin [Pseudomonas protegens]|uniref:fimbrial protein n=1 Tax=Pseudomonas TaxID=286 RepID=UPI000F46B11D|nr:MULTISPECIES: fimbrial protein [Pseudomonas]MCS4258561.1 type 1 fimbria pilin [Pseudomonas sp. BIGb0176]ROQ57971.1 type 1 fimbria pilin [Pseudomonas protegens]ROQ86162.1 type 1 fimbria pilin [Pseudomonas protegens]
MKRNLLLSALVLLLSLWGGGPAYAGGEFSPESSIIQLPASIYISAGTMNGDVIATTAEVDSMMRDPWPQIFSSEPMVYKLQGATLAPGYYNVYLSNVPGVGFRWNAKWRWRENQSGSSQYLVGSGKSLVKLRWVKGDVYKQSMWLEIIKIGDIQSGTLAGNGLVNVAFNCVGICNSKGWTVYTSGKSAVTVQLRVPTCSVSSSQISVPLGRTSNMTFSGVGSTSKAVPFKINLSCSGGDAGASIGAYVSFIDVNNWANQGSTLSLSAGSTASGVGVQILKGATVLGYGSGSVNQWWAGNISAGVSSYDIPLTARYVQTASRVTPGTVSGMATLTMSYR